MERKKKLGVNVDHIATIRQARREGKPDLLKAVSVAIAAGADSIVAHLREDRRHIQDRDILDIRKIARRFDMEMAATPEMLKIALQVKPDMVTLVPEKRKELTTEGGLDVAGNLSKLRRFASKLERSGVRVSLFIDPKPPQIKASSRTGASFIEIHTGKYARTGARKDLKDIADAVRLAKSLGLRVNAGHGLDYHNVGPVARIRGVEELNIGFSIVARSVFTGIRSAVAGMKKLLSLFFILAVLAFPALAQTQEAITPGFVDVPPAHWASAAVNDLVRLGVTQGYPDGTFRGSNNLSRYEMATFVSKMAHAREQRAAENEKVIEELKAELYKIRYTLDTVKKQEARRKPIGGTFLSRLRLGNIVSANTASPTIKAPLGPVFDWRLAASYTRDLGENSFLKLNLDTMDSSISPGRDLFKEMLDLEVEVRFRSSLGIGLTAGPGVVVHRESSANVFPSDDNTVFIRQNNGIRLFYEAPDWETGIGYLADSTNARGIPAVNDYRAYVGRSFRGTFLGNISLGYSLDYFKDLVNTELSSSEIYVSTLDITVTAGKYLEYGLKAATTSSQNTPHNVFVGVSMISRDLFRENSSIKLFANKVGTEFFDYPVYQGLFGANIVNRLFQNGTYDIGLEMVQAVSRELSFRLISDVVTGATGVYGRDEPKSMGTFEMDIDYGVFERGSITFAYRIYQQPAEEENDTSDMLGLGFKYVL